MASIQQQEYGNLGVEEALDIISHPYRRWLLSYLITFDSTTVSLETAVRLITLLDPTTDHQGAKVELHHSHLVKLHRAGIIDYDKSEAEITFLGNELLEELIDVTLVFDKEFSKYN